MEIVALQKGDTQNTHAAWTKYNLAAQNPLVTGRTYGQSGRRSCATAPARPYAAFIAKIPGRRSTSNAMVPSRGADFLSAICGQVATPFYADVFIAHFGPAGVTAAKLRELGVIRGKIATIFHGIDISSREVLNHYTPEYRQHSAVAT